jgi:hypothetical protein
VCVCVCVCAYRSAKSLLICGWNFTAQFEVEYMICYYKVLITRPNTTIRICRISLLLCTITCFGCPDQPSSAWCPIHKKKYKGREAFLYSGKYYKIIFPENLKIRLKLIHNYVTEFLRYNKHGIVI